MNSSLKKYGILCLLIFSVTTFAYGYRFGNTSKSIAKPVTSIMLHNALKMIGTPYVAHTLEINSPIEKLVLNTKEVDCTTFVEIVLARSLCKVQGDSSQFINNMRLIRYRDGNINGYTSRLHYTTEWVINGIKHGFLTDVAASHIKDTLHINLSFMTAHPKSYKQLTDSPQNIAFIAQCEQRLNKEVVHYIPKAKLPKKGFKWIHDGDIILLVTNIKGLDNSHLGIAIYQNGELHLLHASSTGMKVMIQPESLREQLAKSPTNLGIRVVRMKK